MQWLGNLFSWIGLSGTEEPVNTVDNEGDINMSNDTENPVQDIDYTVFQPGDTVYYKDVACKVIEIQHGVFPPRAIVQQIINGNEVNTEFTNLISAENFVQSQDDTLTKEIFDVDDENFEKSESLLKINDNNDNNGTDTKPKPKSVKNKTKSKKKSGSKKKKHIRQIQRPPKKSKRRQRTAKRKKSKKKSRSAKSTNSRSAKRNLKKVKKKQLASKTVKSVKTPKRNERKRRLTEIGIENTNKKAKKNKIKSPPKKRRRMTEPVDINDVEQLVERIYGERINNGNIEYLMKFKGHKKDESIWGKNNDTHSCKQAIKQFKKDLKNDEKSKYMARVVREMNSKKKK